MAELLPQPGPGGDISSELAWGILMEFRQRLVDLPRGFVRSSVRSKGTTMKTLTMEYPEEMLVALGKRADEASGEIRLMAALKLYEAGRLSSGMAAQLAGVSRVEFLLTCGRYGVSVFQQTAEELRDDDAAAFDARTR